MARRGLVRLASFSSLYDWNFDLDSYECALITIKSLVESFRPAANSLSNDLIDRVYIAIKWT